MPKYPATTFDEFNDIEIHSAGGSIDIISVEIEHHCLIDTLSRELSTGELTQFINDLAEEGGVEEVLEGASGLSTILAGISDPGDKVGELAYYAAAASPGGGGVATAAASGTTTITLPSGVSWTQADLEQGY